MSIIFLLFFSGLRDWAMAGWFGEKPTFPMKKEESFKDRLIFIQKITEQQKDT